MVDVKRGENISLLQITPHLDEIIVAVRWFKHSNDGTEFEIDSSAFLLTEQNKIRTNHDFIFYNQSSSPDNAVILKNQMFKISLNGIHQEINKIRFVLTLHNGKQKQQSFGMLSKIMIELFNFADKQKLASYIIDDAKTETAIILAQLYRYNAEWKFKAIGQGYGNGLDALARNYGVDIESNKSEAQKNQLEVVNPKTTPSNLKNNSDIKPDINESKKHAKTKIIKNQQLIPKNSEKQSVSNKSDTDFDIHNTDFMTKQEHYQPIVQWLKFKNFEAEVNEAAMDTSGFFDEVAIELGDDYDLLKIVSNSIKRRQQNGKDRAYIELSNYSPDEIGKLKKFCQHLYDYSFVAKYFYNTRDKKITLQLQSAIKIINFFNGEWLEWYAFMKIAALCHEQKIKFSCTRNMVINLPGESKYEIDVFFLINDTPLFIECKSGEYREFIDKYTRLRRKLFIPKPYFLMLTSGVDDEHVKGLTAMFDITFVNETMLIDYISNIVLKNN